MWKQHPDHTAQQVIKALGPVKHPMKVHWVEKILRRCSLVSARNTSKQLHVGRRRYIPRRSIQYGTG
jgi:hypothetical protein